MYIDWIYYKSPNGRRFAGICDYVHKVAAEIIEKRKETLVIRLTNKDYNTQASTAMLDYNLL